MEKIEILVLGVFKSKDNSKCCLEYAIANYQASLNRKGFNVMQCWYENSNMFNSITEKHIGAVVEADLRYVPSSNGRAKMIIEKIY